MRPRFFIDRNLGTRVLPGALRAAGWDVVTLAEAFGEQAGQATRDEEWLEYAGRENLAVLMKDKHIRYRSAETAALVSHGVAAFCLSKGSLDGEQQAALFLQHEARIMDLATAGGAAIYLVNQSGVKQVPLG